MDQQENWIDQQYVANEAASILEKLAEDPRLEGMAAVQAALTLLREIILNQYGLLKESLLQTDMDDFVEFIVNEDNE